MFDRVGPAQDDVSRRLVVRDVDRDRDAGAMGLIDRRPDIVHRVVVPLIVGDELDRVGAVVEVLPDRLPDLIRRVGIDVFELPERPDFLRHALALPTERRDDLAGGQHRRTVDEAAVDGGHERRPRVVGVVADVLDRREPRVQNHPRVPRAAQRSKRSALTQPLHVRSLPVWWLRGRQTDVRVHQTREDP